MIEERKTPLYEEHLKLGARMGNFAGWKMPLWYKGAMKEHLAVREDRGMFDVSHMGEISVSGDKSEDFIQILVTSDISKLEEGSSLYTVICNEMGGIKDDVIIFRTGENEFLLVVNAINREKIYLWIKNLSKLWGNLKIKDITERIGLIALQGPNSIELLDEAGLSLSIRRFQFQEDELFGEKVTISRTGYTGEDGVEIFSDPEGIRVIWRKLIDMGVEPCGLASRDSLRIEAGFVLYGNEISEEISPIESKLSFVVSKEKEFIGREKIIEKMEMGVDKTRIGFALLEKGIPRRGQEILNLEGEKIGEVTSGTYSPTSGAIGMGYIPPDYKGKIYLKIRNREVEAELRNWPFFDREKYGIGRVRK